jgi:hypothetical protein
MPAQCNATGSFNCPTGQVITGLSGKAGGYVDSAHGFICPIANTILLVISIINTVVLLQNAGLL